MLNFGKVRVSSALLPLVLLLILTGCLGGEPTPAVTSSDNVTLLKNAVANMQALRSYHFSAIVGEPSKQVAMSGDVDVAGHSSSLVITGTERVSNVIVIGGNAYVSQNGGAFTKTSADNLQLDNVLGMWSRFKSDDVGKAAGVLEEGVPATETIDGLSTKHLVGDAARLNALTNVGSKTEPQGTVHFWISTEGTPYVRQMRVEGTSGSTAINGTFRWSRFNERFDIKAP